MMRNPAPRRPSHLIAEGLAYIFAAVLTYLVVGHMAKTPISSDFHISQGAER